MLENRACEERLKRLFGSRNFRQVVVTQYVIRDYLLSRGLCQKSQVAFIWGCAFPPEETTNVLPPDTGYEYSKETLDICFVAHKYMPGGRDKGFDVFLVAARQPKLVDKLVVVEAEPGPAGIAPGKSRGRSTSVETHHR